MGSVETKIKVLYIRGLFEAEFDAVDGALVELFLGVVVEERA